MSLVKCFECGQEISDQAEICVKCGRPLDARGKSNSNKSMLWNAVTKTKTPINIFALAMMACASVLGASATQITGCYSHSAFTYTIHSFIAISGFFSWLFYFAGKEYITPKISTKSGLKHLEILVRIGRLSPQF
jgi:predicted ferric reductase